MYVYIYHIALKIETIYVLIIHNYANIKKINKTRTNIYYSKPIFTTKNFNLPENKVNLLMIRFLVLFIKKYFCSHYTSI